VLRRSSHGGVGVVSQVGGGRHLMLGFGSGQHQWSCAVRLKKKLKTKYCYIIGSQKFKNMLCYRLGRPIIKTVLSVNLVGLFLDCFEVKIRRPCLHNLRFFENVLRLKTHSGERIFKQNANISPGEVDEIF
jgi:hypothetical protein